MKYLIDPNTKKPSVTLTAFLAGFGVACVKLLFAGVQITQTYKLPEFSGVEFASVVGALGLIYGMRRTPNNEKKDEQ